jgi:hypothetical protein
MQEAHPTRGPRTEAQTAEPRAMDASESVRREWLRRIEAEYRSAALTQHLGLWLIQIAAPPDLVTAALAIVGDEMAHAELSHETYRAAGGNAAPAIVRETLELSRGPGPLEHDVLRHGVQIYCLGETVAVRLFERMRRGATEPEAKRALDRILRDEVRHRDFGWTLLEWLLESPAGPELKGLLQRHVASMVEAVRLSYGGAPRTEGADVPVPVVGGGFSESDRVWGLIPRSEYVEAYEETLSRDYQPRFEALGVTIAS